MSQNIGFVLMIMGTIFDYIFFLLQRKFLAEIIPPYNKSL